MQYRRARTKGGTYFFTVVTHQRRKFLCDPENVNLLRLVIKEVMNNHPFTIDAFVLLPDHLHCLWTLPGNDCDFSKRWRLIKGSFSRRCNSLYKGGLSASRQHKKEQAVWQRRFWEHTIRNERDFTQHVEYIHFNPVKHGLTDMPGEWPYSSFHRYVNDGLYELSWGAACELKFNAGVGRE